MDRERACLRSGADAPDLLNPEKDAQHSGDTEKRDDLCAAPRIEFASEADGHQARKESPEHDDGPDQIDGSEALHHPCARPRIDGRNQKHIYRRTRCAEDQIDVEGPPPSGTAHRETAADDGSQHRAKTPSEACQPQVAGSFFVTREDRQEGHNASVHPGTPDAADATADDEGCHGRRSAADR